MKEKLIINKSVLLYSHSKNCRYVAAPFFFDILATAFANYRRKPISLASPVAWTVIKEIIKYKNKTTLRAVVQFFKCVSSYLVF